jgi:hypothetical protein
MDVEIYTTYATRIEARRKEQEIKNKKSRKYIEWLINSTLNRDNIQNNAQSGKSVPRHVGNFTVPLR